MQWRRPIEETFFLGVRCPPLQGHTADAVEDKLYVFGGETKQGCASDLYILETNRDIVRDYDGDGTTEVTNTMVWTQPETLGANKPSPRKGHASALVFSKLFIFGGTEGTKRNNELWILDTETLAWTQPEMSGDIPSPRDGHTLSLVGNRLYLFGGWSGQKESYINDVYSLDTKTFVWQKVHLSGSPPTGRKGHTATVIGSSTLYIFGGYSVDRRLNDLHVLDLGHMHWNQPAVKGNVPQIRSYHSAVLLNGKVFIFGGLGKGSVPLNDYRVLDPGFYNWSLPVTSGREPDLKQARGNHSGTIIGPKLFILGGYNGKKLFNDLLSLDTESEVKKMKARYMFLKSNYPQVFEQMKAGAASGKKKVHWKSGLPFIAELPFSHTVYSEFPQEGRQTFTGKESRFFLLTDWSKFRMQKNWRMEQHPDFWNVYIVLDS